MVLGLKSKQRKDGSVQVNYTVHVQEIKPWLPSSQTLALTWENGDQLTGFLSPTVIDSAIEFNKSFILPLTLRRDKKDRDKFQKSYLEFHLYEPRKDKPNKDQLLGSAVVNLADYGIIDNVLNLSVPFIWKKSSKSGLQPALFIYIQSNDKDETNSSLSSLSKQSSLDKYGHESASEVTNEDNDGDLEIAAFTDDDNDDEYSHLSYLSQKDSSMKQGNGQHPTLPLRAEPTSSNSSKLPERSMTTVRREQTPLAPAPVPFLQSSFSTMGSQNKTVESKTRGLQENIKSNPQPVITTSVKAKVELKFRLLLEN